jgi:hypothetical protein
MLKQEEGSYRVFKPFGTRKVARTRTYDGFVHRVNVGAARESEVGVIAGHAEAVTQLVINLNPYVVLNGPTV